MFKVSKQSYLWSVLVVNKISVTHIYPTYVFLGLNAAKGEIGTLKTSVNTLEREKREHVQSKQVELLQSDFSSEQTGLFSAYKIFMVFKGLNADNKEIEALKTSLEEEKIQKTQGRLLKQ